MTTTTTVSKETHHTFDHYLERTTMILANYFEVPWDIIEKYKESEFQGMTLKEVSEYMDWSFEGDVGGIYGSG